MEKVSIIIPVYNKIDITRRCIEHIRRMNRKESFELVIVDNGSTDETHDTLARDSDIVYIRNRENLGIARACNSAAAAAHHGILCFMHNDVFVWHEDWVSRLAEFIVATRDAGVVGLYGAKVLRKDGSFRGRSIVHAKKGAPVMQSSYTKVAAVDGLLLAMSRRVLQRTGGFDEQFSIHYYDKDISMRAMDWGFTNYVLNLPFEHASASTRKQVKGEDAIREEARTRFADHWQKKLPVNAASLSEKLKLAVGMKLR
jgi:GT2 family glycosyltransferase